MLSHKPQACTNRLGTRKKLFFQLDVTGCRCHMEIRNLPSENGCTCIFKKWNTDSPRHFRLTMCQGQMTADTPRNHQSIAHTIRVLHWDEAYTAKRSLLSSSPWEDVEAALKPIQDLVANSQGTAKLLSGCFKKRIHREGTSRSSRHWHPQVGYGFPEKGSNWDYKTISCWDPSFPFISYLSVKKWNTLPFWGQGVGGNPWFEGFTTGADAMPLAVQTLSVVTRRRVDASLGVPVRSFSSISGMTAWQLNLLCAWILTWSKFKEDGFQLLYELHGFIVHILEYFLLYWFGRLYSPRTCCKYRQQSLRAEMAEI